MPQENGLLEMEGSVENIVYHNDSNQYTVLEVECGEAHVRADGRGGEDHSPHVTGGLGRQR